MRSPSASDLLAACEAGQGRSSVERALILLAAGHPSLDAESLGLLSIGERDGRLLALREHVFGPTFASLSICPACGESLEQPFNVQDVRVKRAAGCADRISVEVDGTVLEFRLPNSHDLAALAHGGDPDSGRARLVERCLLAASPDSAPPAFLPEPVIRAVADRMGHADPQGDVQLALRCPDCAREWVEIFDIGSYLWSELAAWSSRLLDQVHRLAAAYGWRETDILAMSPWRREAYLTRLGR
jgi:hypothetical protein